ncbi:DUF2231 domain-containing protein [Kutzneria sp. CA-103260]|uniref:DUF2231 domain-containing protein n=1 Tax=Kutzneria sp. CA-103260 TaxID=2802641 RepID=UPI001BAB2D8C|nr:DUF2231 domain-containing protein [Kutzneria sp. CA-103260]QUQ63992.1 hypothetical protein JJ691_17120 [Kutzneria sp. CA-103260]
MGPTTINDLPAHVLLVHIVVVFVPLAAILLVCSAVWPAARRRLGIITPLIGLVALVSVPLTTSAGEWLIRRVQPDPLVRAHAHLGDGMLPWAGGLFLATLVVWLLHRYRVRHSEAEARARWLPVASVVVAVLAVVVSVGSVVEVYRIGDSGAQAAWHDNFSANPVSGKKN